MVQTTVRPMTLASSHRRRLVLSKFCPGILRSASCTANWPTGAAPSASPKNHAVAHPRVLGFPQQLTVSCLCNLINQIPKSLQLMPQEWVGCFSAAEGCVIAEIPRHFTLWGFPRACKSNVKVTHCLVFRLLLITCKTSWVVLSWEQRCAQVRQQQCNLPAA